MGSSLLLFAAGLAVTFALALPLARLLVGRASGDDGGAGGATGPLRPLADKVDPWGAAAVIVIAGAAATAALVWLLGEALVRLQSSVDTPVYDWMGDHAPKGAWWPRLNQAVTEMGNSRPSQVVVVVSSVALAVLWRRRAWWLPPLAIVATYLAERFGQQFLKAQVPRLHPAGSQLGGYPSGGVARVVAVWGIVAILTLLVLPSLSRPARVLVWTALAVAAYVEGWTRTYLLRHWLTDVLAGLVFGGLLLAVSATATLVLARATDRRPLTRRSPNKVGFGKRRHPAAVD